MRGHGCDGLVEAIETVVSVVWCERRKATERRRKARWDLENFHQVPEPVGRHRTPDPVGRITCYSTRVWALRWARLRRARRGDRDGGIGCLVRATEADRATAQGVLGLRKFSPSARTSRPKKIARPGRPDHLLFYLGFGPFRSFSTWLSGATRDRPPTTTTAPAVRQSSGRPKSNPNQILVGTCANHSQQASEQASAAGGGWLPGRPAGCDLGLGEFSQIRS